MRPLSRVALALLALGVTTGLALETTHRAEPSVEARDFSTQPVPTTRPFITAPPVEPEPVTTTTTTTTTTLPPAPPVPPIEIQIGPGISVTLEPCGGDLPPCWVKRAESGGDYSAINWTGCGGRGCFGAWQFSGEWACRLGLPCDLALATPEQQDAAARELWAGGRGCSNWSAC